MVGGPSWSLQAHVKCLGFLSQSLKHQWKDSSTVHTIEREDRRCRANIRFISSIDVTEFGGISHLIFFLAGLTIFAESFFELAKSSFRIAEPIEEFSFDLK